MLWIVIPAMCGPKPNWLHGAIALVVGWITPRMPLQSNVPIKRVDGSRRRYWLPLIEGKCLICLCRLHITMQCYDYVVLYVFLIVVMFFGALLTYLNEYIKAAVVRVFAGVNEAVNVYQTALLFSWDEEAPLREQFPHRDRSLVDRSLKKAPTVRYD